MVLLSILIIQPRSHLGCHSIFPLQMRRRKKVCMHQKDNTKIILHYRNLVGTLNLPAKVECKCVITYIEDNTQKEAENIKSNLEILKKYNWCNTSSISKGGGKIDLEVLDVLPNEIAEEVKRHYLSSRKIIPSKNQKKHINYFFALKK